MLSPFFHDFFAASLSAGFHYIYHIFPYDQVLCGVILSSEERLYIASIMYGHDRDHALLIDATREDKRATVDGHRTRPDVAKDRSGTD